MLFLGWDKRGRERERDEIGVGEKRANRQKANELGKQDVCAYIINEVGIYPIHLEINNQMTFWHKSNGN
jgi:hypothetical protein